MHATQNSTTISAPEQSVAGTHPAASGVAAAWARGRRQITPYAYPYMRVLGPVHLIIGLFLVVVGAVLASRGHDGWAAVPLAGAALNLAIGSLDTTAARTAHQRA